MSAQQLKTTFGAIARFETTAELISAVEKVRAAGYTRYDAYTPFPIHGLDHAKGDKRSILPGFVLVGGMTGTATAVLLCGLTSAVDYPIIVAGKPYFSIEAFVPIMFELTILFAAFTALFGMLILNRLPQFYHPVFNNPTFHTRAADDGYFLVVEASDPLFDPTATLDFLAELGGRDLDLVEE